MEDFDQSSSSLSEKDKIHSSSSKLDPGLAASAPSGILFIMQNVSSYPELLNQKPECGTQLLFNKPCR